MADTVTPKLGLIKPEIGASSDSWGNKTNQNWDKVDQSMVRQTKQWTITMGDDTVGSIAGGWALSRYGNDELLIDSPITVNRQTGVVTISGKLGVSNLLNPISMPYQAVAPSAPPAGEAKIYIDVNGNPVIMRPDGVVMHLGLAPGMITYTGATTPDAGCAFLNGQLINRAANPVLYLRYGTAYGAGDGVTTFGLPDAKGCVFAHPDQGAGRLTVTHFGIAPTIGNRGGLEYNTLTNSVIPSHFHTAGIYDPTHTHGVAGGVYGGNSTNGRPQSFSYDTTSPIGAQAIAINGASTGVRVTSPNGNDNTYSTGGGGNHANVQPTMVMNAQIKLG